MLDALLPYLGQVLTRHTRRIFATTHPYLALSVPLFVIPWFGDDLGLSALKIGDTITASATYNTVIFGFCAAATALVLAIPNERFLQFISTRAGSTTPFRDIIFVFSWTGVVHWIAFALSLLCLVFYGNDAIIKITSSTSHEYKLFMIYATAQIYAFLQFLVTMIAVYEVGDLYGKFLQTQNRP
jgi:hypothetical protein